MSTAFRYGQIMDLISALSHLLSGTAGAAVLVAALKLWTAYEKKMGRGEALPAYKNKFFDELGEMMKAHTEEIRHVNAQLVKFEPIITAVDNNNYPKTWSDHEQLRRTHENVGRAVEILGEHTIMISEIRKQVDK